jgi:hypothetical protein
MFAVFAMIAGFQGNPLSICVLDCCHGCCCYRFVEGRGYAVSHAFGPPSPLPPLLPMLQVLPVSGGDGEAARLVKLVHRLAYCLAIATVVPYCGRFFTQIPAATDTALQ